MLRSARLTIAYSSTVTEPHFSARPARFQRNFLILSCPFHIHSILKLVPVLSQKSEKMHLVRTFCSSTAKTSTVTPIFYFIFLIRTVLPFDEKKNWHKSMFKFLAILLNCTDWAITGRSARVQFYSTLESKVKTSAWKVIILVRKWINNTSKSNFVRYSFGLRAVFVKGS